MVKVLRLNEDLEENNLKTFSDDLSNESVEVLRERLNAMKRLVAERQQQSNTTPGKINFDAIPLEI